MVRAIDELSTVSTDDKPGAGAESPLGLLAALGDTKLRVWAELGRTRMPLGRALSLPLGAVIDLDQAADAPVDLFVNGVAFARGHLVVQGGEWALRIDELLPSSGSFFAGGASAPAPPAAARPFTPPQAQASDSEAESTDPNQLEGALT